MLGLGLVKVGPKEFINLNSTLHVDLNNDEDMASVTVHWPKMVKTYSGTSAEIVIERLGMLIDPVFMQAFWRDVATRFLKGTKKKRGPKPNPLIQRKVELLQKYPTLSVAKIITDEFIIERLALHLDEGHEPKTAKYMAEADGKSFFLEEQSRVRALVSDYELNKPKDKRRKNKREMSAKKINP